MYPDSVPGDLTRVLLKQATPIGRCARYIPLGENSSYGFTDIECVKILTDFGIQVPTEYGIVRPSKFNVEKALLEGDKREVFNIPSEVTSVAVDYTVKHFRELIGKFTRRSLEHVKFVGDTSAGFPYRMKKDQFCYRYPEYLQWYCSPNNVLRPVPIWTANPKVEYMDSEKIANGKIRIFRNPPVDYFLLEKMYYGDMDEVFMKLSNTWSALGFVKEHGGWHRLFTELAKWPVKVTYDVKFWDKGYGPTLDGLVEQVRDNFFENEVHELYAYDLAWLKENATYSLELLPDGWIVGTSLDQKSGRLKTSTNNTIAHIILTFCHYLRVCDQKHLQPSYEHAISVIAPKLYSDDNVGGALDESWVSLPDLRATFQLAGFDIKDYVVSNSVEGLVFLGAACGTWIYRGHRYFVPIYHESRMLYALQVVGGRMRSRERAERVCGLAHNLCFSPSSKAVEYLANQLKARGLWPSDIPLPNMEEIRRSFVF